jgi:membrane-bound metal-dependent hydrolase YbcI (DUF457 family)
MMGPTHRLVGTTTGFVAATAVGLSVPVSAGVAVMSGLSSSVPDDLEKLLHVEHRTVTHRPALQLIVIAALAALASLVVPLALAVVLAGSVAIGCVMHSAADAMTIDRRGIQLLWPIRRRGYHLLPPFMRASVGSKSISELAFSVAWCAIVISYLYVRYGNHISA